MVFLLNAAKKAGYRLLPAFLSLLPLLILTWNAETDLNRTLEEQKENWLKSTDSLAAQMERISTLEFWLEAFSLRVKRAWHRRLSRGLTMPESLEQSLFVASIPFFSKPRVWAVEFNDDGPEGMGKTCVGSSFEANSRGIMANFLTDAALQTIGKPGKLSQAVMASRLKTIMGLGTTTELFSGPCRGRAFPILYEKSFAIALWDVLYRQGKIAGAYLLILPTSVQPEREALRLTLLNWKRLFPGSRITPAFLPLPDKPGYTSRRILARKMPDDPRFRDDLDKILNGMLIAAGSVNPEAWHYREKFDDQNEARLQRSPSYLGMIRLHSLEFGKILELGNPQTHTPSLAFWGYTPPRGDNRRWWARFANLEATTGHIALLVEKAPRNPVLLSRLLARCLSFIWGIFWFTFWIVECAGWEIPTLGLRRELIFWFLGLVVTPVTFGLVTSIQHSRDLKENLIDRKQRELEQILNTLENDSISIRRKNVEICESISSNPAMGKELESIRQSGTPADSFLNRIWNEASKKGIKLSGILVVGGGGFSICKFSPLILPIRKNLIFRICEKLNEKVLELEDPIYFGEMLPKTSLASTTGYLDQFMRFEKSKDVKLSKGAGQIGAGNHRYTKHDSLIQNNGKTRFVLTILWEPLFENREYLKTSIRESAYQQHIRLAALEILGNTPQTLVTRSGDQRELAPLLQVARKAAEKPIVRLKETAGDLYFARPSVKFPGFILGAAASLQDIQIRLSEERKTIFIALALLIALVVLAGLGLSDWLAEPILRMTDALKAVEGGNLSVRVASLRGDEIGKAAQTLDQMIQRLNERQKMGQFVSPQVLEIVSRGDENALFQGATRDAVILVSDIRSFTTHSERCHPREIFSMLNTHLTVMTTAIHEQKGTIDRFIGDAIQAAFYDSGGESPALRALRAAKEMVKSHRQLNRERQMRGEFPYQIGVGLAFGKVVTGVVGDPETRLDFTVMGEPLKEAHELEGASKIGKASRIICHGSFKEWADSSMNFIALENTDNLWELSDSVAEHPSSRLSDSSQTISNPPDSKGIPLRETSPKLTWMANVKTIFPVIFWLIPLLLAYVSSHLTFRSQQENEEALQEKILSRQTQFLEKAFSPEIALSIFASRELSRLHDLIKHAPDERVAFESLIPANVAGLSQELGDASWVLFEHLPESLYEPNEHSDNSERLLASGNLLFQIDEETFFLLNTTIQSYCQGITHGPFREIENQKRFSRFFAYEETLTDNLVPALGWSKKAAGEKKPRLFWEPFLTKKLSNSNIFGNIHHRDVLGILFLILDVEKFSNERGLRCAAHLLADEGTTAIFFDSQRRPLFNVVSVDPSVQAMISENPKGSGGNGAVLWKNGTSIDGTNFLLLRKCASDSQAVGAHLKGILKAAAASWFLLGLVVLCRQWLGSPLSFSLSTVLILAFIFILGPALGIGTLLLERSGMERHYRVESNLEKQLEQTLVNFEEGFKAYNAVYINCLRSIGRNPRNLKDLRNLDRSPNPLDQLRRVLEGIFQEMVCRGVSPSPLFLATNDGLAINLLPTPLTENQNYLTTVFSDLFSHAMSALGDRGRKTDGEKAQRDLLTGAKVEELRDMILLVSPPELFARMISAPRMYVDLQLGTYHHNLYRDYFEAGKDRYFTLQANWVGFRILWHQMNTMREIPGVELSFTSLSDPTIFFVPPYWYPFDEDSRGSLSWEGLKAFIDPKEREMNLLAQNSQSSVSDYFSRDDERFLLHCSPGKFVTEILLQAKGSLTLAWSEIRLLVNAQRWTMLAFFLLVILLAIQVSHRILIPILAFTDAAKRYMNAEVHVSLREDRKDEFGILAKAFNSMVRGVEEGKRLRRFVSDAVRLAATDTQREEAAKKGISLNAVILFAGIAGFKNLLHETEPHRLVESLNAYLRNMSRKVRDNGGEIDKFIGDKVLAVFYPHSLGGLENAMESAVRAGEAMCRNLGEVDLFSHSKLGVGLVSGRVLAGILGTPLVRLEYTVIGDPVNLASRLCDVALSQPDGGVVIEGEITRNLKKESLNAAPRFARLPISTVKGKSREIEIFLLKHCG